MNNEGYKACVRVAACICAKDGIISELEEQAMFEKLKEKFPGVSEEMFEETLTEFFDSKEQIEDYLQQISDGGLREFSLELAEQSAGADGLDIKENIALQKACLIWDMNSHA